MKKYLSIVLVLLLGLVIFTGCSKKDPAPQDNNEDDRHIKVRKGTITVSVGKDVKYFSEDLIKAEAGKRVAGVFVSVSNQGVDPIHIAPSYVTIKTSLNKTYNYSPERTAITGKGAFREVDIPHDGRGGGLLLFEIDAKEKIKEVNYKDKIGNDITVPLNEEETSQI